MPTVTLSIVIPSHRDASSLRTLLPRVAKQAELIVVSSEPDEAVEALCHQQGAQYVPTEPCRGAQLDIGARRARGDVIWFLHADAEPPSNAADEIRTAISGGAVAGWFAFQFQGEPSAGKKLLARLINLRVALGGIAYGDQGLFVTRQAYLHAGGYPHQPLFEEVRLIKNLRKLGAVAALDTPILVSARRWQRDGWWQRSFKNRWLALRFMLGADPEQLAKAYASKTR